MSTPVVVDLTPLPGVHPDFARAELLTRKECAANGIVYQVDRKDGLVRSEADTARYMAYRDAEYAIYVRKLRANNPAAVPVSKYTWRPIAVYGSSYHNYGRAMDVDMVQGTHAQVAAIAQKYGLRWGGTFPTARKDVRHFESAITLLEAKRTWLALGNTPGVAMVAKATTAALVLFLLGGLALYARAGHLHV